MDDFPGLLDALLPYLTSKYVVWVLVAVIVLDLINRKFNFTSGIKAAWDAYKEHKVDTREAEQKSKEQAQKHKAELEEVLYEIIAQTISSNVSSHQVQESQAMNMLKDAMDWSKEDFSEMQKQLVMFHYAINQIRDILTVHGMELAEIKTFMRKLAEKAFENEKFNFSVSVGDDSGNRDD